MHLAHDVEAMQQAIVRQQREVDAIRRALESLQAAWEREEGLTPETRDPAAENSPLLKGTWMSNDWYFPGLEGVIAGETAISDGRGGADLSRLYH